MKVVIKNADPLYDYVDFLNFFWHEAGIDLLKEGRESRKDPRIVSAVEEGRFAGASAVDVPDNATDWIVIMESEREEYVIYVVNGKIDFVYSLVGGGEK